MLMFQILIIYPNNSTKIRQKTEKRGFAEALHIFLPMYQLVAQNMFG